jgi:hypothetical protein
MLWLSKEPSSDESEGTVESVQVVELLDSSWGSLAEGERRLLLRLLGCLGLRRDLFLFLAGVDGDVMICWRVMADVVVDCG